MAEIIKESAGEWASFTNLEMSFSPKLQQIQWAVARIDTEKETFKFWQKTIRYEIDENRPIAISTKQKGAAHIRTVVGYDDRDKYFRLYNTDIGGGPVQNLQQTNPTATAGRIAFAGFEKYSYSDAKRDWDEPDHCRDLLTLSPSI